MMKVNQIDTQCMVSTLNDHDMHFNLTDLGERQICTIKCLCLLLCKKIRDIEPLTLIYQEYDVKVYVQNVCMNVCIIM